MKDHVNCRCWSCFIQDNFTSFALFFMVVIALGLTVGLMHEASIDDKYVTWLEGFTAGAFSAWALALRTNVPHAPAPGTQESSVVVTTPKPDPQKETEPIQESK